MILKLYYILLKPITIPILLYNLSIIVLYNFSSITQINRNYVLSQYAFTYQKMGFVARGLLPSIFEFLNLNNKNTYYIFFNIIIILYIISIIYIVNKYANKHKRYLLVFILLIYFGIPHFSIDALRPDSFIILLAVWVFVLLEKKQILLSFILSVIGLFIHEAIFFILIPIILLSLNNNKQKIFISVFLTCIFLSIIFLSNKTTEDNAIQIIKNFKDVTLIKRMFYIGYTSNITDNIKFYFSTTNNGFLFFVLSLGIFTFIFCFRELFQKTVLNTNLLVFFPLLLCFVAIDYSRWLHFSFFLLILYSLKLNTLNRNTFKRLLFCLPISLLFNPAIVILIASVVKFITAV